MKMGDKIFIFFVSDFEVLLVFKMQKDGRNRYRGTR